MKKGYLGLLFAVPLAIIFSFMFTQLLGYAGIAVGICIGAAIGGALCIAFSEAEKEDKKKESSKDCENK
ncbi:MAG: hypothetical protein LUG91_00580 [Ruminococcus sp.]|nr:hypothetical protein [Ruminococcus sp.]